MQILGCLGLSMNREVYKRPRSQGGRRWRNSPSTVRQYSSVQPLEGNDGITIDNFSMRGSAGTTLANIPDNTLREFNAIRPYDLIILQFGVNAVKDNSTTKDMRDYLAQMRNVIRKFRRCYPQASILVVSTPDRGSKEGGATMPNIKALEGYQKELAAEERVGFYSLFHAMGGRRLYGQTSRQGNEFIRLCACKPWRRKDYSPTDVQLFCSSRKNYIRRKKLENEK